MRTFRPLVGSLAVVGTVAAMGVVGLVIPSAAQAATTGSQTFGYSASTQTFTVPAGVTQLTVTAAGGEGGLGGADGAGNSYPGGYRGQVTGTIAVTPGQMITVAVGHGGANGANNATGPNGPSLSTAAPGGTNPLGGYNGGNGGIAGWQGSSGYGGGGGAATVVQVGSATIVAGGSGGAGGSGQYAPTKGRAPYSTFTAAPGTTTAGQVGITIYNVCNNAPAPGCDGGGGGPGGGGAQGGAQGAVEFGSGTSDEWFGYGGYPGSNSTGAISTLSASYVPYSDNASNGSVTFSWNAGVPDAPTNVTGTPGNQSVALSWTAPTNGGGSAITDYIVQYALASNPTSWTPVDTGSASTSATITGLTNSTGYIFQVAAVNTTGQGAFSASSSTVTPIGPPPAPVITAITPADGALSVAFSQSAPPGSATVVGYQYSLDGGVTWVSAGVTSSPLTVPGLTNGTAYSVEIRAVSSVGDTAASAPMSGTPASVPGAPTIVSISTSPQAASVSFTPGYSGGGAVTGYEYQLNGTGPWIGAGSTSPIAITGLADGTTYTVAVRAQSADGPSSPSLPSSFTTPSVPGAPTVTVTPGDRQLSIAYVAGSPGGSTITGYDYSLDGGSTWTSATASPIVVTGLTNGTAYSVSVRADNVLGAGAGSTPQPATPATTPSAPTITSNNVAGSGQLSVDFTAPTSNGGAAITNYQYSTDAGATWRAFSPATTSSPVVISTLSSDGMTSLTNATYPIELRAVNSAGAGTASATNDGTAATVPAAPTLTAVTTGSSSLQVTFTPPANGGSPITGYEYTLDGGTSWHSTGTVGSTFTITGLTNGTPYPVQVRAINGLGDSSPSNLISATPSTTAAQPTITGVVRSNHTLTVSVNDANNGGAAITDYQYSTDGGATWHSSGSASSPLTITTLSTNGTTSIANGTSYPVQVRAVNAAGVSVASTTTNVGPAAPPSAPIVSLSAGNQSAGVTFSIPDDGGSPVSAIEYELNNSGTWISAGTLSSPFTISGLTNGTTYTVNLRADNAIGTGTASNPATVTPYTVPGAPTAVVAISDTASADVSWTAPTDTGGSAITGYTATAYTDPAAGTAVGTACVTPAGTTSCIITGLTNGTTYYVSVTANNAAGTGLPSSPRAQVIPLARPAAPTLGAITAGDSTLTVPFTFPNGYLNGSTLVSYQYQLNGGTWVTMSTTTSPLVITGLSDGTSYTVALRAVSTAGNGAASATSPASTPFTYPSAPDPTMIVTTAQNGALLVTWVAPNNNGSPITGYTVTAFTALTAGSQVTTCTTTGALSCTLIGLSNGTTYYVSVQAANAAGASERSTPRVAGTPAAVPNAPAAPTVTAGDTQASLTWTAPANNGSAITDYQLYYSSDGVNYTLFTDGVSTATSSTVTGLTNGTPYTFKVAAVNANGTGPLSPASASITPVATGTTPTLSTATPTNTGYTFTITNYDAATTYTFAATNSATTSRSGNTVTVANLGAGASSTVTVTAAKTGYSTTIASVSGTAIPALPTPTFGSVVRTPTGYTVPIANFDSSETYTATATVGSATLSGGYVVVLGLTPGQSSTVTLTASKTNFQSASNTVTNTALALGTAPTYSNLTSTVGGFTVTIANYNGSYTYGPIVSAGSVAISGANLTVTGLTPGQSATITLGVQNGNTTWATSTVTGAALATGVTPTLSGAVSTDTGFTSSITNYDPAYSYSASASGSGSASVDSSGVVTVTGLSNGASSTVTVTATRAGYTTATSTPLTGSALLTGTGVTLSPVTSTNTGYVFTVTNYDASYTYSVSAPGATAAIDASGVVTVTGLSNGASATTTVTATRTGYTTRTAQTAGSALLIGTTPTLSTLVSTASGYTFVIANYDPSYTYTATSTAGTAVVDSSGNVTVTGLSDGASATSTVTATRTGYTSNSTPITAAALLTGVTPTLSATTSTDTGYTFSITNYDPAFSYVVTGASATIDSSGLVTVTGLVNGAAATASVTSSRVGYTSLSAQASGTALLTGSTPTLSTSTSTDTGYTFSITNYDPAFTYTVTGGTATIDSTGLVTVTGLVDGAGNTVTVTTTRTGYTTLSSSVDGDALLTGSLPVLTTPTSANGGFIFSISNYDPNYDYTASASSGSATIDASGVVTVAGLADGASLAVTITSTRSGHTTLSAQVTGSALLSGTGPILSTPVQTNDGFTFTITNFDPSVTYTATTTGGTVVVDSATGLVTITGLAPSGDATVIVTASQTGHLDAAGSVHAAALAAGSTPTFSAISQTADGFTFTITNYDPTYTYSYNAPGATVVVNAAGLVTVTGLAPGTAATVTVTATKAGHAIKTAQISGAALASGTTPKTSAPTSTSHGFTFDIANYDPTATYTATATNGATVSIDSSGHVTVTGLAPGTSSTVTITVHTTGQTDTQIVVSGSSASLSIAPPAPLANTGSDLREGLLAGLALTLIGAALLLAGVRRRIYSHPAE